MSHRAALYTVRVKRKYGDYRMLGDIDEAGTSLGDVFETFLEDLEQESAAGDKLVRCHDVARDGDELLVELRHGATGVAAEIFGQAGDLRYRQVSTDTQFLRAGAVFRMPPTQETGFLAAHLNHGRGVKGLLETGLLVRFRNRFDDLKLEMNPLVRREAYEEAIEAGRVDKIRLIKVERPNDLAVAARQKWIRGGTYGTFELDISASTRGARLKNDLLQRFFRAEQPQQVVSQILEFQGLQFDRAKVEVELANGTRRTFNLEDPSSGHPMTLELDDLDLDGEGNPTIDSIFAGLQGALDELE